MRFIDIPAWGTITIIEAVWLFSGLLAFTFAAFRLPALIGDYVLTKNIGEEDLRVIALGHLRREVMRMAQGFLISSIGVYAALEPPSIPGPARTTITGLVITAALLGVSFLVVLQTALDWRDRANILQEVSKRKDHSPTENAILLVDETGKIVYSNVVADTVFGRRLIGVNVEELVPERLRAAHREHRAQYAKNPTNRPMGIDLGTMGLHADGSEFPIYATLSPFTNEIGEEFTMLTAKLGEDP